MSPPEMTPGEKVAAEWEARHDVAARGAHASSAGVQDYLRHRHEEELRGHPSRHPHQPAPTREPAVPEAPPPSPPSPAARWWQRLLRRGPR